MAVVSDIAAISVNQTHKHETTQVEGLESGWPNKHKHFNSSRQSGCVMACRPTTAELFKICNAQRIWTEERRLTIILKMHRRVVDCIVIPWTSPSTITWPEAFADP
jgi:hypothetical protein